MDLLVLIIVMRAGYIGTLRGMLVEAVRLLALFAAIAVGAMLATPLADQLMAFIPLDHDLLEAVAFFTLVILTLLLSLLVKRWLSGVFKQHATAVWNQAIGATLGAAAGVLMAGLVVWGIVSIPWDYFHTSVVDRSLTGGTALRMIQTAARITATLRGGAAPSSHFWGS